MQQLVTVCTRLFNSFKSFKVLDRAWIGWPKPLQTRAEALLERAVSPVSRNGSPMYWAISPMHRVLRALWLQKRAVL